MEMISIPKAEFLRLKKIEQNAYNFTDMMTDFEPELSLEFVEKIKNSSNRIGKKFNNLDELNDYFKKIENN